MKKSSEKLFQGEILISKKECWLIGTILVYCGSQAPCKHSVPLSAHSSAAVSVFRTSAGAKHRPFFFVLFFAAFARP